MVWEPKYLEPSDRHSLLYAVCKPLSLGGPEHVVHRPCTAALVALKVSCKLFVLSGRW